MVLFIALFTLLFSMSYGVYAQPASLPGLFDVTGVASNDVLNIRAHSNAASDRIGALAHNATAIEVITTTTDGRWGLVNHEDRSGWVAMRFMRENSSWRQNPPNGLICAGTEPFWAFGFQGNNLPEADFTPMSLANSETVYQSVWSGQVQNRIAGTFAFKSGSEITGTGIQASGFVQAELCSDGMSDRAYGYSINMIIDGSAPFAVSGCCSIQTN